MVPETACDSGAVNVSPVGAVLLQIFALASNCNDVPAATVPVVGAGGVFAGPGDGAGVAPGVAAGFAAGAAEGAAEGAAARFGAFGAGAGGVGGAGTGAATGAGSTAGAGGVTGTSCSLGCAAESVPAMARSRAVAESLVAASLPDLPPHAASAQQTATVIAAPTMRGQRRVYSDERVPCDADVFVYASMRNTPCRDVRRGRVSDDQTGLNLPSQPVPAREALRRLLPYYHPYRWQVALGLGAVVLAAALASVVPTLLRRGIDNMRSGNDTTALWRVAALMLLTAVVSGALRFVMRQLLNGVSRRIETDLRHELFAHLTSLDATWHMRYRTGDVMARLTNDLSAVRMATGPAIMYLVNTVAGGLFAMIMMLRISPILTGAALLPMAGLPVLMLRLGKRVHARFEAVQSQFSELSTRAHENVAGVRIVRAYQQEHAESARLSALGERYLNANVSLARLNGLMSPGFALLAGIGGAVTVAVGGRLLIQGQITVGGYLAFGIYLAMLTWPLIALGWTTNLFQRGAASMSRVLEILDAAPGVVTTPPDDRAPVTLPPHTGGRTLEFRNVWFHYPVANGATAAEQPRWVLRDVSFTVPAGATLAVVGATGAGKSALMDLIPRLFDPQRGEIVLDGIPIRTLPVHALRDEIGSVPQESLLFSETIGANIAYGLADHVTPSDVMPRDAVHADAIAQAVEIAQLSDTIQRLPSGLDTRLGERGVNLSGGQKQRTALARALARHPRIVLLDDALSAVDTQTEAAILAGLRGALAGRTAVIASHRISAVREADYIVVLDQGAVVEQGRHDDLVARRGRYAQLLNRQQLLEAIESA